MRCLICTREDAAAVNLELLKRVGRSTGRIAMLAKKLKVSRQTLWRHRKEHLKIHVSKQRPKVEGLSFEERARQLAMEAERIQVQLENGLPRVDTDQALKTVALRLKALEMEARFSGQGFRSKEEVALSLKDPEEEARVMKEFQEVVGGDQ
jgi:hypothetical protein